MVSRTAIGLMVCPECKDGKRYIPAGLRRHLVDVHHKDLCPWCGLDRAIGNHSCVPHDIRLQANLMKELGIH